MRPETFYIFYRNSLIWVSLSDFLVYNLGVGIARYLGVTINLLIYILGLGWVLGLQLATYFLNDYFERLEGTKIFFREETSEKNDSDKFLIFEKRNRSLILSAFFFTTTSSITVVLLSYGRLSISAVFIMSIGFVGALLYALPPFKLVTSGYGEILSAFLLVNLVPFWSFVLQDEVLHRFVPMGTFPLTALFLGMLIIMQFPVYGLYVRKNRKVLSIRIGWENSIVLHNGLIIGAFLFLLIAAVFGFPRFVVIPTFFVLPLGIWQIWYINQIGKGDVPNWNLVTYGGIGLFGIAAYIMAFSFWIN